MPSHALNSHICLFYSIHRRQREDTRSLDPIRHSQLPNPWPMWEVYEVVSRGGMHTDINLWCSLQTPPEKLISNPNPNIPWQVIWWWWLAFQCNLHYYYPNKRRNTKYPAHWKLSGAFCRPESLALWRTIWFFCRVSLFDYTSYSNIKENLVFLTSEIYANGL
jgi:hypothetical protein